MKPSVVVDCFPESALRYNRGYAVVAVDVIRATTTIATCLARGRRCFPVATLAEAREVSSCLDNPLCAGEIGGIVPQGFDVNNSPAEIDLRTDILRPLVVLSSSGTKLITLGRQCEALYVGCLRNFAALAEHLARRHDQVAVIGAGSRGSFREEDQMCCAWIARRLVDAGFTCASPATSDLVNRWKVGDVRKLSSGASAEYLRRTSQGKDLNFIISHVADLEDVIVLNGAEVVTLGSSTERDLTLTASPSAPEYAR